MPQGATISIERGSNGRAAPHRRSSVQDAGYNGDGTGWGSLCSAIWPRATASCRSAVRKRHSEIAGRRLPSRATARSASAA
ncbi:hypothetical protein SUDANB15_00014 [Streptomyces sp. enrichment culture]